MSGFEIIGAVIGIAGAMVQASGQVAEGEAAKEDAYFQAEQEERQGKEEFASAQREALAARREARLAASRGQAVAAAQGGGAGVESPTVLNILADIEAQGEVNANTYLYQGESRRFGAYEVAEANRRTGRARAQGARTSAMGTILGGFGKAFSSLGGYSGGGSFGFAG